MRKTTRKGLKLIKSFEKFAATVYTCPAGYKTIGYGHVIRKGEDFSDRITIEKAEELLKHDVATAEYAVLRLVNVPLTDNQFNALISFTFNLGAGALQRSTLRCKVNRHEHEEVPRQFMRWVWARGRKLKGLIIRREIEANLYSGDLGD